MQTSLRAGFVKEPLFKFGAGQQLIGQNFYGERTIKHRVARAIDCAHSAIANLFLKDVIANLVRRGHENQPAYLLLFFDPEYRPQIIVKLELSQAPRINDKSSIRVEIAKARSYNPCAHHARLAP